MSAAAAVGTDGVGHLAVVPQLRRLMSGSSVRSTSDDTTPGAPWRSRRLFSPTPNATTHARASSVAGRPVRAPSSRRRSTTPRRVEGAAASARHVAGVRVVSCGLSDSPCLRLSRGYGSPRRAGDRMRTDPVDVDVAHEPVSRSTTVPPGRRSTTKPVDTGEVRRGCCTLHGEQPASTLRTFRVTWVHWTDGRGDHRRGRIGREHALLFAASAGGGGTIWAVLPTAAVPLPGRHAVIGDPPSVAKRGRTESVSSWRAVRRSDRPRHLRRPPRAREQRGHPARSCS
jgi:hypothetical protein